MSKVIALVLAFFFISMMCSTVWAVNFQTTAFKAETYVDTLAEEDFYENIVPLILPAIAQEVELTEQDTTLGANILFRDVVENLDQDDWNDIALEIVPPDYLQEQAERNMNNFFAYANGDQIVLDVVFDTSVIRDNLLGQPGDRMINRIFSSWPECTMLQEAQMQRFIREEQGQFPYCKPADTELQRSAFTLLNDAKNELAAEIPEEWDVREQTAEHQNLTLRQVDRQLYNEIQGPTIVMQRLYPLAFLIPCIFLALIVIVAVRSAKSFFAWMGWTVAASGLFALLPLALIPFIVSGLFSSTSPHDAEMDAIQAEAIRGVARSLVGDFTMPILTMGAGLAVIGFFLIFISILLHDPDEEDDFYPEKMKNVHPMPVGSTPSTQFFHPIHTTPPPPPSGSTPGRTPVLPPVPPPPPQPPHPIPSPEDNTLVDPTQEQQE